MPVGKILKIEKYKNSLYEEVLDCKSYIYITIALGCRCSVVIAVMLNTF